MSGALEEWSLLAGRQDFILGHSGDLASDGARLYFKAKSPRLRAALEAELSDRLARRWPEAVYAFSEAANPFNLVFTGDGPTLVAMLRGRDGSMPEPDRLNALIARIRAARPDLRLEPVSWQEQIVLEADPEKLALYGVSYDQVYASLSRATHERTLLTIRSGSSSVPVFVTGGPQAGRRTADLLSLQVPGRDSTTVPLSYVLEEHRSRDLSRVISGRDMGQLMRETGHRVKHVLIASYLDIRDFFIIGEERHAAHRPLVIWILNLCCPLDSTLLFWIEIPKRHGHERKHIVFKRACQFIWHRLLPPTRSLFRNDGKTCHRHQSPIRRLRICTNAPMQRR